MDIQLKNGRAAVEIQSLGAELVSFQKDGYEYIWNGDKTYWAGHAPVLFPICCAAYRNEITVDGRRYPLGNHGFARKKEFELVRQSDNHAAFRLTYDNNTLAMYPFKFELLIGYTLEANRLKVEYQVSNADDQDICFQLGTHTGFNCPLGTDEQFEDYYLEFEYKETLDRLFLNPANVLIPGKSALLLKDDAVLPLTHGLFHDGGLVLKGVKSRKVALRSRKSSRSVVMAYENLPYLTIWQAVDAPFLCIEPFHGIADEDGYTGEFRDKEMMVTLGSGRSWACSNMIEIH
jgi:galactose mutarotase-like enzyme